MQSILTVLEDTSKSRVQEYWLDPNVEENEADLYKALKRKKFASDNKENIDPLNQVIQ